MSRRQALIIAACLSLSQLWCGLSFARTGAQTTAGKHETSLGRASTTFDDQTYSRPRVDTRRAARAALGGNPLVPLLERLCPDRLQQPKNLLALSPRQAAAGSFPATDEDRRAEASLMARRLRGPDHFQAGYLAGSCLGYVSAQSAGSALQSVREILQATDSDPSARQVLELLQWGLAQIQHQAVGKEDGLDGNYKAGFFSFGRPNNTPTD